NRMRNLPGPEAASPPRDSPTCIQARSPRCRIARLVASVTVTDNVGAAVDLTGAVITIGVRESRGITAAGHLHCYGRRLGHPTTSSMWPRNAPWLLKMPCAKSD